MPVSRLSDVHSSGRGVTRRRSTLSMSPVMVEFTIEVRRPHRVNRPAMHMPCFAVTVIRFGVHVDQWHQKHPCRRPQRHDKTEPTD